MSLTTCLPLLESYIGTLANQFAVRSQDAAGCWLETPFYLPDNTRLGVYVKSLPNGRYEITDYGETVGNLYLGGVTVDGDDHRFVTIAKRFGVDTTGGEISLEADAKNLSEAINAVIHAILDTSYLVYTRRLRAAPSFIGEIDAWLTLEHRHFRRHYDVVGV